MSVRSINCPSCGAQLQLTSSIAMSVVCPYCRSLVVRSDVDAQALGRVAQLPPDLSPLQVGTTGTLGGVAFRLTGRVRWQWEGGSWTEWYAEADKAGHRWLAETQGFYTLTTAHPQTTLPSLDTLEAGATLTIDDTRFTVVDVKTATPVGAEGELPAPLPASRRSFDLQGPGASFASIEETANGIDLYSGRYATFAECNFAGLRDVPGWTPGAADASVAGTSFACPQCGAPITVRVSGLTMSAVCGSCGSIVDAADPTHALLEKAERNLSVIKVVLPIGTRGKLRDVEYEVIGCVARNDGSSTWHEYLVFNPWHGFDWLVTWNGHWALVERLLQTPPRGPRGELRIGGQSFRVFSTYGATVEAVLGEFYWKTAIGERTTVTDYVAPPLVASEESYPGLDEVTWSQGTYVDHALVAKAFKVKLAPPKGIWLNQPNPYRSRSRGLGRIAAVALALLVIIQLVFLVLRPTRELTRVEQHIAHSDGGRSFASAPFTVSGESSRIEVDGSAPLSNQWASFDLTLINEATGEHYERELDIEYYFGTDSDGAWTEGGTTSSASFSTIPPGTYHLLIEPTFDPKMSDLGFAIDVHQGGLFWSSLLIAFGLVLVYPINNVMRGFAFESQRWADSGSAKDS